MFKKKKRDHNPMIKIAFLMNQYHSIESMEATKEEKEWAKKRLEKRILKTTKGLSDRLIVELKTSMKSKSIWEGLREQYLN